MADTNEPMGRHVRDRGGTASDGDPRVGSGDLGLSHEPEPAPDRQHARASGLARDTAEVVSAAKPSSLGVETSSADLVLRMSDHQSNAEPTVPTTPVFRPVQEDEVEAVRDLEVLNLGRRIAKVELVVHELDLPPG